MTNLTISIPDDFHFELRGVIQEEVKTAFNTLIDAKEMDDVLTVKEVADYLKMSQPTVREMMRSNGLPYRKVRQCIRFYRYEVLEWLLNSKEKESL